MPLDIYKLGASPSSNPGVPPPPFTLALVPSERPPVVSPALTPAAGQVSPAVAPAPGSGVPGKGASPGAGVGGAQGSGASGSGVSGSGGGGVAGAGGDAQAWARDLAKRGLPVEVTSGVLSGPDGAFARGVIAGASVNPALTGANARGEIWFGPSGQVAAPSDAMIAALERVEKGRRGDPLTPAQWRDHAAFLKAYPGGRSPANPSAPGLTPVMPDFALLALTPLPAGVPDAFFKEMRSSKPFTPPYSQEAANVLGSAPLVDFAQRVRPQDAAELDRLTRNAPPALRVYARLTLAQTGSMDMVRAVLERGEAGLPQGPLPDGGDLPKGEMFKSARAFLDWRTSPGAPPWPGLSGEKASQLAQTWIDRKDAPADIVAAAKALLGGVVATDQPGANRRIDLPERTGLPGGDDVARVAEETGLSAQEIARVQRERGVSAQDAANILKSRIFGRWTGTGGAMGGAPPLPPGTGPATTPGGGEDSPENVARNIASADVDVVKRWWSGLSGPEMADLPGVIIQAVAQRLRETGNPSLGRRAGVDRPAMTGAPEQDIASMKAGLTERAVRDLGLNPAAAPPFVDQTWSKIEDGHRSPGEIGLIFDRFIDRAALFVPGRAYLPRLAPSVGVTIRGDLFARLIGPDYGYTVPAALDVVSDRTWSDAALIRAQQAFFTSTRVAMDMVLLQMLGPDARTVMSYLGQTNSDDPTVYGPIVRRITRGELTTAEQALLAENEPPRGAGQRKELAAQAVEILKDGGLVKIVRDKLTSQVVVDRVQGDEGYEYGDLYIHNYGSMMGYVVTGATDFWVQRHGKDTWTPHVSHDSVSLEPGDSVRMAPIDWRTRATFQQSAPPGGRTVPDESKSITIEMPPY